MIHTEKITRLIAIAINDQKAVSSLDFAKMHRMAAQCQREEATIHLLNAGVRCLDAATRWLKSEA